MTLWLFMGLAFWAIATTKKSVSNQEQIIAVGSLLFFGAITFGVVKGGKLARIIPMYENPLPSTKEKTRAFFSGLTLARNCGHLDHLADGCATSRLSTFGFNDPLVGETVVWHEPTVGIATVVELMRAVDEHPASVDNLIAVLNELRLLETALRLAKEKKVRFALLLEIGSVTDLKDWEIRKAHF